MRLDMTNLSLLMVHPSLACSTLGESRLVLVAEGLFTEKGQTRKWGSLWGQSPSKSQVHHLCSCSQSKYMHHKLHLSTHVLVYNHAIWENLLICLAKVVLPEHVAPLNELHMSKNQPHNYIVMGRLTHPMPTRIILVLSSGNPLLWGAPMVY